MILSDSKLKRLISSKCLVIEPLSDDSIQQNGVDFRMTDELAMRASAEISEIIDGASTDSVKKSFHVSKSVDGYFVLAPLQNYLLTTREHLKMPNDLMGFCGLRSTFARLGFVSPLTIIDAGFEGTLTISVFYGGNNPIKVPVGCRFLHVVFAKLMGKVETPYQGHYNKQKGVSLPKALV